MDEHNINCEWKGAANVKFEEQKDWILRICKAYVSGENSFAQVSDTQWLLYC